MKILVEKSWGGGQGNFEREVVKGWALKGDVKHYFDTIDHKILLRIIGLKIKDAHVIWLIKNILINHNAKAAGKGMPIGNLTSQFFANVYLNELDQFVKHELKVKYYMRYVDDFVILDRGRNGLESLSCKIDDFLKSNLKIELHNEKTRVVALKRGITLLGFRVFYHYKLLKKSNARRIWKRLDRFKQKYESGRITIQCAEQSLNGWLAYAKFANTYNFRGKVIERFDELFSET